MTVDYEPEEEGWTGMFAIDEDGYVECPLTDVNRLLFFVVPLALTLEIQDEYMNTVVSGSIAEIKFDALVNRKHEMEDKANNANVLLLGLGAGEMIHMIRTFHPSLKVDVCEIDPVVTKLAKQFFEFKETENIKVYHADCLDFVNTCVKENKQYSCICLDAYFDDDENQRWISNPLFHHHLAKILKPAGCITIDVILPLTRKTSNMLKIMIQKLRL
eukprot:UN24624